MNSVASKYAQALADFINKEKLNQTILELKEVKEIVQELKELKFLLLARFIPRNEKVKILELVFDKIKIQQNLKGFLILLAEKNRFDILNEIILHLEEIERERKGILILEFKSASEIENNLKQEIKNNLSRKLGQNLEVNFRVDPELIFGFRICFDHKIIDFSLAEIFRQLKREV